VLFDFESDAELDRLHWKCFTLMSQSDEYVSHGEKSLRLELYPSDYPGLAPMLKDNDWRGYKALRFDVYNPMEKDIRLAVRIDDRAEYPDYKDRYNKGFILKKGLNRIEIPLTSLVTSGTKRNMELGKIYRFLVFMVSPQEKHVFYVDYIRLVS